MSQNFEKQSIVCLSAIQIIINTIVDNNKIIYDFDKASKQLENQVSICREKKEYLEQFISLSKERCSYIEKQINEFINSKGTFYEKNAIKLQILYDEIQLKINIALSGLVIVYETITKYEIAIEKLLLISLRKEKPVKVLEDNDLESMIREQNIIVNSILDDVLGGMFDPSLINADDALIAASNTIEKLKKKLKK